MPGLSAVNEVTRQSRVSNMAGINTSPEWAERSLTQLCGKGTVSVVWRLGKRRLQEATSFVRVTWLVQVWKGTDSTRAPGGGHGNPLQYSCLKNPKDRGAWQTTVHGAARVGYDRRHWACTHSLWCRAVCSFTPHCSQWSFRSLHRKPGLSRVTGSTLTLYPWTHFISDSC